jgi:HSP20 family protein
LSDDEWTESLGEIALGRPSAIRSFVEDFLFGEAAPFYNLESKSLRPLCRIESTEGAVTVTFDLPYVEKEDITLSSDTSTLEVDAKMRKPVKLRVGGTVQKSVLFERYTARVRLPLSVMPEKAKATFRNGLLRIRFPTSKKGHKVKIR